MTPLKKRSCVHCDSVVYVFFCSICIVNVLNNYYTKRKLDFLVNYLWQSELKLHAHEVDVISKYRVGMWRKKLIFGPIRNLERHYTSII